MAFTNIDFNTASFTTADMVIGYEDPISWQWLAKLANNTGYNYRHSRQRLIIESDSYAGGEEKDYDTTIDYTNSYMMIISKTSGSPLTLPENIDTGTLFVRVLQLTAGYQAIRFGSNYDIKFLAGGGFRIINGNVGAGYLLAVLIELRLV